MKPSWKMGKIMKAYESMQVKPVIETTKNAFKIILPNINAKYETENATVKTKSGTPVAICSANRKTFPSLVCQCRCPRIPMGVPFSAGKARSGK